MGTVHLNPLETTLRIAEQINEIKMLFLQNVHNFKGPRKREAVDSMLCISHVAYVFLL